MNYYCISIGFFSFSSTTSWFFLKNLAYMHIKTNHEISVAVITASSTFYTAIYFIA